MTLRIAMIALAALGGVALASGTASAMPKAIPLADQIAGQSLNIEQARYVCNEWGRCSWRPNWYGAYGYYRPHPWRWHRWHRY